MSRVRTGEPDPSLVAEVTQIFNQFISEGESPVDELPSAFSEFFKVKRIISFRKKVPKGLNQKGEMLLKEGRVWVLWLFVMVVDKGEPASEIIKVFKEGMKIVKNKDCLIEGLGSLFEKCPELEVTAEDEQEIERILGRKIVNAPKEVIAKSTCGEFGLVKLTKDQQNRFKSECAVVPAAKNPWLYEAECQDTMSLNKLLLRSNYCYHPSP